MRAVLILALPLEEDTTVLWSYRAISGRERLQSETAPAATLNGRIMVMEFSPARGMQMSARGRERMAALLLARAIRGAVIRWQPVGRASQTADMPRYQERVAEQEAAVVGPAPPRKIEEEEDSHTI
jgi:hypothetical protein